MPFIIARRSDVQNGSILVTDLFPDQSQANPTVDPKPQGPYYVRKTVFGDDFGDLPVVSSNGDIRTISSPAKGVIGYVLRHIANAAGGALTVSQALAITSRIRTLVLAGDELTAAVLNTEVDDEIAGADFDGDGSDSSGVVSELLRILAGETYVLPVGTQIQDNAGNIVVVLADSAFANDNRRLVERDKSWQSSFSSGSLASLVSATTTIFGGTSVNVTPLVTVYNTDGTVYGA